MQAIEELERALKHLENARDQLQQGPFCKAEGEIIYAISCGKHALELLKQEKEE